MHWTVAGPVVSNPGDLWLTPFVPGDRHTFTNVPRRDKLANLNWHDRATASPGLEEWKGMWKQSREAFVTTEGGVITIFPQAASLVGAQQRLARITGKKVPVLAWWFDVNCYQGVRRWLAQTSLSQVDRFVVHTTPERELYSQWLDFPIEQFQFVPLQIGDIPLEYPENTEEPFIVATGSAFRDFPTLFESVKRLNIKTVVISGPRALAGFELPPQVSAPFGLKKPEILKLVQEALISVVPVHVHQPAPGIVTIVEAMQMGRPIIATRCPGIDDYITDGETGILVEPNSVEALTEAIDRLWNDTSLRHQLGANAKQYAADHLSDKAAGATLGRILDELADAAGMK